MSKKVVLLSNFEASRLCMVFFFDVGPESYFIDILLQNVQEIYVLQCNWDGMSVVLNMRGSRFCSLCAK